MILINELMKLFIHSGGLVVLIKLLSVTIHVLQYTIAVAVPCFFFVPSCVLVEQEEEEECCSVAVCVVGGNTG